MEIMEHQSRHTQRRRNEGPPEDPNKVQPEVTFAQVSQTNGKDGGPPPNRDPAKTHE